MPHVDDGILHAYLDGALDALSDAGELPQGMTGADVVSHLGVCGDCRARLQTERDIRERAGLVLGDAALPHVDVPPFANMAGLPRVQRRRWIPMSWAASVLLALGAGWWGSEVWRAQEAGIAAVDRAPSATSAPEHTQGSADLPRSAGMPEAEALEAADVPPLAANEAGTAQNSAHAPAPLPSRPVSRDSAPPADEPGIGLAAAESVSANAESAYRRSLQPLTPPLGDPRVSELAERAIVTDRAERFRFRADAGLSPADVAADSAAFQGMLARLESGTMPFVAALPADSQTISEQVFVISGASAPAIDIAKELGQTTVRVRQTLVSGEDVEVLSWQQQRIRPDLLVTAGRIAAPQQAARAALAPQAAQPPSAAAADRTAESTKAADARAESDFVVDGRLLRALPDGRRELVLHSASGRVWIAVRADASETELRALMSRLTERVPPR